MTLKVLVIDDHPLVQEGVSAALETLADNVTVMSARDGEQGLGLAAENPDLDLVLLDLALPGISGFNLIGKLHEKLPSLTRCSAVSTRGSRERPPRHQRGLRWDSCRSRLQRKYSSKYSSRCWRAT